MFFKSFFFYIYEHSTLFTCLYSLGRPWLIDNLDAWIDRLRGDAHYCAAVFVDNCGIDLVLGIFPFVRELIKRGTKVRRGF